MEISFSGDIMFVCSYDEMLKDVSFIQEKAIEMQDRYFCVLRISDLKRKKTYIQEYKKYDVELFFPKKDKGIKGLLHLFFGSSALIYLKNNSNIIDCFLHASEQSCAELCLICKDNKRLFFSSMCDDLIEFRYVFYGDSESTKDGSFIKVIKSNSDSVFEGFFGTRKV